jgi:hypothetical protein
MKTEELIRALAMDSTLPRASPHADGPPRSKRSRSPNRDPAFRNNLQARECQASNLSLAIRRPGHTWCSWHRRRHMKFVVVNGRTPRTRSFCALCCESIEESASKSVRSGTRHPLMPGAEVSRPGSTPRAGTTPASPTSRTRMATAGCSRNGVIAMCDVLWKLPPSAPLTRERKEFPCAQSLTGRWMSTA